MNINIFFIATSAFLLIILFVFKPLDIKQESLKDVPLFNMSTFTMQELNTQGLITLMSGSEGVKYSNRYTVKDIDYTDNSKDYVANMTAINGVYKNDIVTLVGDVVYFREDGLTFETKKAVYNKKTSISRADGEYVLYRNSDRVIGKKLRYNNESEKIKSINVTAKYQLKEGK